MSIILSEFHFNDKAVAADWKDIYDSNPRLTYYSSYEFNKLFLASYNSSRRRRAMRLFLIRAYDEEKGTRMILPMAKHHHNFYPMWDYSSVPYCDGIYRSDITGDELDYIFNHLGDVLGEGIIYFTKMNESSVITQYLSSRFTPYKKRDGGKIDLLRTYDYTYLLLSKECREHIEEAKAKVIEQRHNFRTDIYFQKPLPAKAMSDLLVVLHGDNDSYLRRLSGNKYEKHNPTTLSVEHGQESLVALSYIDGYPVACLYGFVRNGVFIVSKFVSTRYGVSFSARHLIMNDVIKYSVDKEEISTIDLWRTDDKTRADFAAKNHQISWFEVKI
ncbi:MAG: hypothetical protein IJQ80_02485 [Clostridia bacterium]|nr:hypothetical protein [Clostridia bacterium]